MEKEECVRACVCTHARVCVCVRVGVGMGVCAGVCAWLGIGGGGGSVRALLITSPRILHSICFFITFECLVIQARELFHLY